MSKNLRWKWLLIAVVILSCIVGVIGFPTSVTELAANWNKNIRLGLDLKGGSQIVLQMQVQDAFKSEADAAIERLKEILAKQSIPYASITLGILILFFLIDRTRHAQHARAHASP